MNSQDKINYLSKSLVMRGLQCLTSLYLYKFQPELREPPSEDQEALFQTGYEIGDYGKALFPGGEEVPYEGLTHQEQLDRTRDLINQGVPVIYEATFSYDGIFVKVDILRKTKSGWELNEVKASTSLKEHYLNDIAIQYLVLKGAGLTVNRAFLVRIDNTYERQGPIEPGKLLCRDEVTNEVETRQEIIREAIREMRKMLAGSPLVVDIGPHCEDPYECDFSGHCWKHIPEDSVFSLAGPGTNPYDLYHQGYLRLAEVPPEMLTPKHRFQQEYLRDQKDRVDKEAVRDFLSTLWYPLAFLDFETINPAVPLFDGTRPYQKVPYQYSLHLIEQEGSEVVHREFLLDPPDDPRRPLAEQLLRDIPPEACLLAFNASFEGQLLDALAKWFPDLAKRINPMRENLLDIAGPFRRREVYDWRMNGSYSLKKVLPVMIPEMSYEGLEIQNGGMVGGAYFSMLGSQDPTERQRLRQALLDYCRQDTLAMVKILEKLKSLIGSK
jgi:hypothetical protein